MMNPLLSQLNKKNEMTQTMSLIKSLFAGKNPDDVIKELVRTNPSFKKFVEENGNKSLEDICMEYDIDMNLLKQFM